VPVLFERFEDKGLAQYSYAVGCEQAGEIAIVDPRRDVGIYLDFAAARGLGISHVVETHIHADFASGAGALADRTGATIQLSAYDRGEVYEAAFPHEALEDGSTLVVGSARIEALHTPGHTPEHLAFLVFDTARAVAVPQILLSGDFLFVGSVGRPDLIGDDVKQALAGRQFDSVQRLKGLPDGLEVHPGHGAGSMCGAGLGARPMSTLGFERTANPYLDPSLTRDAFVARLLAHVPPFPPYYRRMKVVNAKGAPALDVTRADRPIAPAAFRDLVASGHVVVDLRGPAAYSAAHVPRAFAIGEGTQLSTWASWVAPYETPLLLVTDRPEQLHEVAAAFGRVGLDDLRGHLAGGMQAWRAAGFDTATTGYLAPRQLAEALAADPSLTLLDVRDDDEWAAGHVCGAEHVMAGHLPERAPALASRGSFAVMCAGGYRSTVAASVLERAGARGIVNADGGLQAWQAAGLPVCTD
jgi:hydroxyacylglutathione hydrolase